QYGGPMIASSRALVPRRPLCPSSSMTRSGFLLWLFAFGPVAGGCGGDAGSNPDAGAGGQDAGPACVEPAAGDPPSDVFCIGLYADRDPTKYDKTAVPYTPGLLFWSDGAEKQRFLYLPPNKTIDTSDMDAWKFPVGTKAFKEFRLDGVLVETRLLWKSS